MAIDFLNNINLNKNELQNVVIHPQGSPPGTPTEGQIYYDSSGGDQRPYFYNGSSWISLLNSSTISFTVNVNEQENNLIPFVADGETTAGNYGLEMNTLFHYRPETGLLTTTGLTATGAINAATVTTSGKIIVNDATDATTTANGSLQTVGGLSVAKDVVTGAHVGIGKNLSLYSDSSVFKMGVNDDFTISHDGTTGATIAGTPVNITGGGASTWKTEAGAITIDAEAAGIILDGHTGVSIQSSNSGEVDITSAANIDINAGTGVTIDGTTISIDGTDDVNLSVTSSTDGEDLTIAQIGAHDSSIIITAAGTGADAVKIDATAGSMLIAPNLIDGKTLKIGPAGATQIVLTPHGTPGSERIDITNAEGTADNAIKIDAVAGGLTLAAGNDSLIIDADGTDADALQITSAGGIDMTSAGSGLDIDITATGGKVNVAATEDGANAIYLHANGGTTETIKVHADQGTGAGSIELTSDVGSIDINAGDNITMDASDDITLTTATADGLITLHSAYEAGQAILIDANAHAGSILDIDAGILDIDTQGVASIDSGGTLSLATANPGVAVTIGNSTSEVTIGDNLTVTGDLTVSGTTTTVNSTTVTIDDPIFTLGGDSAPASDDNKDRGIEFRYHDGSSALRGFFGWDDSATEFTGYTAATNTAEVFSGTRMNANFGVGTFTSLDVSGNIDIDGTITGNGFNAALAKTFTLNDAESAGNNVSSENNGAASSYFTITHGMGASRNYKVEVVQVSDYATVFADVTRPSNETIRVTFATDVDLGDYLALVTKC